MALASVGLAKGKIETIKWSVLAESLGSDSDFATPSSFVPSSGAGVREVVISTGRATAWGVDVTNDAPISLFVDEAVVGNRAWAICLRRDWTTGVASVVKLDCGSSYPQRPASATSPRNGANVDHQLIAYAVASPGSTAVRIIDCRIFSDKVRYAMSNEGRAWDPQPGRLTRMPDGSWWTGVPNAASGITSDVTAFKRFYSFDVEGLTSQFIGRPDGNVRILWPMGSLPFTPFVVGEPVIHHSPAIRSAREMIRALVDYSRPPTREAGNFLLRRGDGTPYVDTTWAETQIVLSRMTITIAEA